MSSHLESRDGEHEPMAKRPVQCGRERNSISRVGLSVQALGVDAELIGLQDRNRAEGHESDNDNLDVVLIWHVNLLVALVPLTCIGRPEGGFPFQHPNLVSRSEQLKIEFAPSGMRRSPGGNLTTLLVELADSNRDLLGAMSPFAAT